MTDSTLIILFSQVALFLLISMIFGAIALKFGQPKVIGELIGGVLTGALLAQLSNIPKFEILHFVSKTTPQFNGLAQLGMLLFMFIAGLEVNLDLASKKKKPSILSGFFGMLLPFAMGVGAIWIFPWMKGESSHIDNMTYGLFIGVSLALSALPVILKILMDLNLINSEEGTVILTSATISDLLCWTFFACLVSFMGTMGSIFGIVIIILKFTVFPIVVLALGSDFMQNPVRNFKRKFGKSIGYLETAILVILLIAACAEWLGIHPFFAVFILGIALRKRFVGSVAQTVLHRFAMDFFAPLYFISIGFKVNFFLYFDLKLCLIILLIACVGKIVGSGIGARLGGMSLKSATAVGFGLNARGAVEIIIATVALEMKIIDERMFVAIVLMAILTSIIAGVALRILLGSRQSVLSEKFVEPIPTRHIVYENNTPLKEI